MSSLAYAWKPQFAGHRGGYTGVMNTAESYRNGVSKYHYAGLECDVRVTADGYYVISHDETTNAVGGNLTVANATLAQLQAETYSQTRGGVTYTGHICTMDTFLSICAELNVFPIIELKWATGINNNEMTNFPGLYNLITRYNLQDRAIILTSMLNSLIYVRQNYPNLKCQYLMNSLNDTRFEACVQYGLEPSIQTSGITACDVKRCHDAGLQVAGWTVNSEADYRLYGNMGVYMMTCDYLYPDQMPQLAAVDWDDICQVQVDPFERLYVSPLYNFTEAGASKLSTFPGGSAQAQQACYVDGVWYANDYTTATIYAFDTLGNQLTAPFTGALRHGICRDDAGHIIINNSPTAGAPSQLLIRRTPTSQPDTINFALVHDGQTNFPSASGDIYSAQGGYVYFFPNGQTYVDALHIANGQLQEVLTSGSLSLTSTTAGWVIPIQNDPTHFIYNVRANGFYMYNSEDKGAYVATGATTTAPGRNSSVGGTLFTLGSHTMFLHGSGSNYNGGFTIRDMSGSNTPVYTQAPLGTCGYSGNPSTGAFFWVETIDSVTVDIHEWNLGNGYAGWRISSKKPLVMTPVSGVVLSEHQVTVPCLGTLQLSATVLPDSAYNKTISWSTLQPAVATVSEEGLVSAIAPGTAAIVVTTEDGGFADTCLVTVEDNLSITLTNLYTDSCLTWLQGLNIRRIVADEEHIYVLALDNQLQPSLFRASVTAPSVAEQISTEVCMVVGDNGAISYTKSFMPLSDIALTSDGLLVGCNEEYTTFAPANPFLIYRWDEVDGQLTPSVWMNPATTQTAGNYTKASAGHSMAWLGSSQDGQLVAEVHTMGSEARAIRFVAIKVTNGQQSKIAYQRPATSPNMATAGEDMQLYPYSANQWVFAGAGYSPRLYNVAADAQNPNYSEMSASLLGRSGLAAFEQDGVMITCVPETDGLSFYATGSDFSVARPVSTTIFPTGFALTPAADQRQMTAIAGNSLYLLRGNQLSRFAFGASDGPATGFSTDSAQDEAVKFIRNGQILIRRAGHTYTATGLLVE